jgi:5-methylcytosine-specific restriction endonuclease McrA
MKNKKPSAERVWKQFEDLAPRLRLSTTDRVVYTHLFRHSRLEGTLQLRFSITWLARGVGLCGNAVRWAVRRLIVRGALRLVERSKAGHVVEVRLPDQVPVVAAGPNNPRPLCPNRADHFEELDFLKHPALRRAIHLRERGRCFYCLSPLAVSTRCIDHVIPLVELQDNSYRNLVSCCRKCNSQKSDLTAEGHLRRLHDDGRLTAAQLTARLRASDALVAGKLPPSHVAAALRRCSLARGVAAPLRGCSSVLRF